MWGRGLFSLNSSLLPFLAFPFPETRGNLFYDLSAGAHPFQNDCRIVTLTDPAFFTDEDWFYDLFAQQRCDDPVHWKVGPDGLGLWSVFKNADVKKILNDMPLFGFEPEGNMPIFNSDDEIVATEAFGIGQSILVADPPRHSEMRKFVDRPFTSRALEELSQRCGRLIKDVFDCLPENGECDVVSDIGPRILMPVICDILKIPVQDWDTIFKWGKMTLGSGDAEYVEAGSSMLETTLSGFLSMLAYCSKLAFEWRGCPFSNPFTQSANAEIVGKRLTDSEVAYNGLVLLNAGFETTRNAFAGGVLALLQNADQMSKLRTNPKLIRLAVEEMLRWRSPVISVMCVATADTELGSKKIKEGDRIVAWLASANRDEEGFERPHKSDVKRQPNLHVGFSCGQHFCVGDPLAKLEISFGLQEVLDRYDGIEIIGPVERVHANFVGGLKRLPLRLKPKASRQQAAIRRERDGRVAGAPVGLRDGMRSIIVKGCVTVENASDSEVSPSPLPFGF